LYAARFIEGTFSIAVVSMLMTMAVDMAPANRRGMTLGIFTLGMLIGNAAGAPLGGVLSTNMGYGAPFFLGTILLLVIAVVVALFVRDTPSLAHAYRLRESLDTAHAQPRTLEAFATPVR
jgi:predicted MFS family arabinose efflux permease